MNSFNQAPTDLPVAMSHVEITDQRCDESTEPIHQQVGHCVVQARPLHIQAERDVHQILKNFPDRSNRYRASERYDCEIDRGSLHAMGDIEAVHNHESDQAGYERRRAV